MKNKLEEETPKEEYSYHNVLFSPDLSFFILECLGPGVPITSLYTTKNYPQKPKLVAILQNNVKLKVRIIIFFLYLTYGKEFHIKIKMKN